MCVCAFLHRRPIVIVQTRQDGTLGDDMTDTPSRCCRRLVLTSNVFFFRADYIMELEDIHAHFVTLFLLHICTALRCHGGIQNFSSTKGKLLCNVISPPHLHCVTLVCDTQNFSSTKGKLRHSYDSTVAQPVYRRYSKT